MSFPYGCELDLFRVLPSNTENVALTPAVSIQQSVQNIFLDMNISESKCGNFIFPNENVNSVTDDATGVIDVNVRAPFYMECSAAYNFTYGFSAEGSGDLELLTIDNAVSKNATIDCSYSGPIKITAQYCDLVIGHPEYTEWEFPPSIGDQAGIVAYERVVGSFQYGDTLDLTCDFLTKAAENLAACICGGGETPSPTVSNDLNNTTASANSDNSNSTDDDNDNTSGTMPFVFQASKSIIATALLSIFFGITVIIPK